MNNLPGEQNEERALIERQFIYLLLNDLEMVRKWSVSPLSIDMFLFQHQTILRAIQESLAKGCKLTNRTFRYYIKTNNFPKEAIGLEVTLSTCRFSKTNKNNYPLLEKKIIDYYRQDKEGKALLAFTNKCQGGNFEERLQSIKVLHETLEPLSDRNLFKKNLSIFLSFPMEAIPTVLHPLIESASKSVICPKDYIAIPLLTALAGSIGRTYEIKIKPGWFESTAMWTVAVGKPGSKKSPALKPATKGVDNVQNQYIAEYKEQLKQYQTELKLYKKQFRKWEKGDVGSGNSMPVEPEKPVRKRNVVNDATVEALAPIMMDNPRGVMLLRDELAGWITSMNQYKGGKGNDVQFYLECWSGGQYSIDRKNLDVPIIIPHTYLTVCGTCQSETLRSLLSKSRQDDGFSARLLPYYPEQIDGIFNEDGISPSLYEPINELYSKFADFQMVEDEWGQKKPNVLSLSTDGKEAWKKAMERHHELKSKNNIEGILESAWAKQTAHIARLALVIHLVRFHSEETQSKDVDSKSVLMAERLSLYFLAHIDKIWSQSGKQVRMQKELTLYDKLKIWDDKGKEITARNMISSKFATDKEEAIKLLDKLEQEGKGSWVDRDKRQFKLVA